LALGGIRRGDEFAASLVEKAHVGHSFELIGRVVGVATTSWARPQCPDSTSTWPRRAVVPAG
jgi:hypothetical protein